jgi:myo-inositol-1(or 4)-monophosphatase
LTNMNSNRIDRSASLSRENLSELRKIAIQAVEAGMNMVRDWRERGADLEVQIVEAESIYDKYVTAADHASEAAVSEVIRKYDPDAIIIGEEPVDEYAGKTVWTVDPIDGTTNLVNGKSFVSVAVAMLVNGRPVVGATGCPFTGELWSAAEGLGTFDHAGQRIKLAERQRNERYIALDPATPTPNQESWWNDAHSRIAKVCGQVAPRASIALALSYVAGGRFDGFVQLGGASAQDFAAGTLLIREAGGNISGLGGHSDVWNSDVIIAGTPQTFEDLSTEFQGFAEKPS